MPCKTPSQVKAELERKGVSISAWAVSNGLNPFLVYELLAGRKKGKRGEAHRAAVLLGLKDGVIVDRDEIKSTLNAGRARAAA